MATNNTNLSLRVGNRYFDLEVEYKIEGRYTPSTWDEPEEFPDVIIESMIEANTKERIFEEDLTEEEILKLKTNLLASFED